MARCAAGRAPGCGAAAPLRVRCAARHRRVRAPTGDALRDGALSFDVHHSSAASGGGRARSPDALVSRCPRVRLPWRSQQGCVPCTHNRFATRANIVSGYRAAWTNYTVDNFNYYIGVNNVNWFDANRSCASSGFRFAQFSSTNDLERAHAGLRAIYTGLAHYWIGLHDSQHEGHWEWADGSPMAITPRWAGATMLPDNGGEHWHERGGEDCVEVVDESSGGGGSHDNLWNDLHCEHWVRSYLCQGARCAARPAAGGRRPPGTSCLRPAGHHSMPSRHLREPSRPRGCRGAALTGCRRAAAAAPSAACAPGHGGDTCLQCPAGYYAPGGTLAPCEACPSGHTSAAGAADCHAVADLLGLQVRRRWAAGRWALVRCTLHAACGGCSYARDALLVGRRR